MKMQLFSITLTLLASTLFAVPSTHGGPALCNRTDPSAPLGHIEPVGIVGTVNTPQRIVQPTYNLAAQLPAAGCNDVTLSPDGCRLYARHVFGPNDTGWRVFDACPPYDFIDECQIGPMLRVPWESDISADGSTLWMSWYYGGVVRAISVDPLTCEEVIDPIDVGSWTDAVRFDDDRQYLYVGENDPGTGALGSIKVIDTWSVPPVEVCGVPLNGEPGRLVKCPGDPFIYTISRNAGTERLYKISTVALCQEVGTLDLAGLGGDVGFSLSPDCSLLYIPSPNDGLIYIVDADSLSIVDTLPAESPEGCYVAPSGDHAIVTNTNSVRLLELPSGDELQLWSVAGVGKGGAVWDHCGRTVYVPAAYSGVLVLERTPALGDLNCDGSLNGLDIDAFVLALTYESQYGIVYPDCDRSLADCNCDGSVDGLDIDPFVECLTQPPCCPQCSD